MTTVNFKRPAVSRKPNINSFFDEFFTNEFKGFPTQRLATKTPKVNILETKEVHELHFSAPGFKKEDFNIDVEGDRLTVHAEVKKSEENEGETFIRKEFGFQSFTRSFTLPETIDIDGVEAKYENGILNVILPKKEEAKALPPRKVKVA